MFLLISVSYSTMTNSHPRSFANRDLRDRSFKHQALSGVDFSSADLRGCDFSRAQLIGANLQGIKTGQTLRQVIVRGAVAIAVMLGFGDAVMRLVYGSLGQTSDERAWSYVLVLCGVLGIAGAVSAARSFMSRKSRLAGLAGHLTASLSAALLGFYYAGSLAGNNPQAATAGAIGGGALLLLISIWLKMPIVTIATTTAGAVAAYGAAFFSGAWAIAFLSTRSGVWGLLLSAVSLLYFWLTVRSLILLARQFRYAIGTSFWGANLTNAQFDGTPLPNTDFSNAIGSPFKQ